MADKNGWARAVGSPGGKSRLGAKHGSGRQKTKRVRGRVRDSGKRKARG